MRIFLAALAACAAIVLTLPGTARSDDEATYDIVILNGRVMDPETMFDEVRNVGIKGDTIAKITKDAITGKTTIDAKGHVVTAGFIDTHFHSLDTFAVKCGLRDGVTTGMDLELGCWDVKGWYDGKKNKWPMNYGTTVSQEICRMAVHDAKDGIDFSKPIDAATMSAARAASRNDGVDGWSVTRSSTEQINQIMKHLDEGLRQGALGIGSTVGYMMEGVSTYEMFETQRTAARYGRLTAVHHRFHASNNTPTEAPTSFNEIFTNAFLLKAPLLVCHNNDYGWWEIEEKLKLARKAGLNMWSEYYPYTAGASTIGSAQLVPEFWEGKLGYKYEETLYDPVQDKFLDKAGYQEVVKADPGRVVVVYVLARKEWLPMWLRVPHMVVASDAMWSTDENGKPLSWEDPYERYSGHPRTAGTHGKILRLGREQGIPLMFQLSQMSYWHAKHLGDAGIEAMKTRGRMQEGMTADIVIFDPVNVKDNATYKRGESGLPTTGMPYVLVNGQIVVKDSKAQKVMAGKPVRFPVEAKGRHVPLSRKDWEKGHMIDTSPLAPEAPQPAKPKK